MPHVHLMNSLGLTDRGREGREYRAVFQTVLDSVTASRSSASKNRPYYSIVFGIVKGFLYKILSPGIV